MIKRWNVYNFIWFSAFTILLSWLLEIPLIGLAFLSVAFLFLFVFSRAKSEVPWLVWIIPYFALMVVFLWIFIGGNPLHFFFYGFWLSLDKWFAYPVTSYGRVIILFAIMYPMIYLLSRTIVKKFNASIPLSIAVVVIGIVSQFINPFVTVGMIALFIFSLFLNALYHGEFISKSILKFLGIVAAVSFFIFALGLTFKPSSPMESVFNTLFVSKTAPSTSINSVLPKKTVVVPVVSIPPATSTKTSSTPDLGAFYTMVVDATGIVTIGVSAIMIFFMIKYRQKRKKKRNTKTIIFVVWAIISMLFIFVSALYGLSMLNPGTKSISGIVPQKQPSSQSNTTFIASKVAAPPHKITHAGSSLFSNPIFFGAIILMAGAFVIFLGYYIFKYGIPSNGKTGEEAEIEGVDFKFEKESYDFKGDPGKMVLFYYRLLRKKIGDPTLTPYEFSEALKKYVEVENATRLTEIFMKLRYAHNDITQSEADFVKTSVLKVIGNI